ncbi:MAG: ABC transporter ATP-binding protein [Aquificae bacterium]|nr:ABC transporter ATP-binding protein [Aquificota bacterium]
MFQTLQRLKDYFYPYRWILLLALLGSLLEGISYSGLSFVVKNLIDKVLVEKNSSLLWVVVFSVILLGVLKQVGFLLGELLYKYTVVRVVNDLRRKVFEKFLNLPTEVFLSRPSGEWVSRLTNDLKALKDYLEGFGVKLAREFFTVLLLTGVLLYFDWKLFLLFLLISPLLAKSFSYFGRKRKKYSKLYQETLADFLNFVDNVSQAFENLKFLSRFYLLRLFLNRLRKLFKVEFKTVVYSAGYLSVIEILGYLFVSAVLLYGGWRVIEGDLTAGTFISFLGTLFLLYNSLQQLQRAAVSLKALEPILERIEEFLALPSEKERGKPFKGLKNSIKVEKLSLEVNGKTLLEDINISFPKGEKVFIYGPSGGGKSTLLKVLSSIYTNYRGKVLYDETELRELNLSTFRGKTYYQSQKVVLFNDTVRNNLLIANPRAGEKELLKALLLAKADFVLNWEKGLNTIVGGGGVNLSGGQQQRIALARLFLKHPQIIFLDEATSALDPETEREVIKNILSTYPEANIFFVSHRPQTATFFDRRLKVEKGKIYLP